MTLIPTKKEYYRLARLGLCGNSPQTWTTVESFLSESTLPFVGIRCTIPGSDKFRPFVKRDELKSVFSGLDLKEGEYIISSVLLPGDILVHGELGHLNGQWVFYHSFSQCQMRKALTIDGRHARGYFAVWGLLGRYCSPSDLEDIRDLFDAYTVDRNYPIIELAATKRSDLGILPNRNTLIWEIRHY